MLRIDTAMNKPRKKNEMKTHRTNSTFGFCRHAKNQPEKTKRAISCQRSAKQEQYYQI